MDDEAIPPDPVGVRIAQEFYAEARITGRGNGKTAAQAAWIREDARRAWVCPNEERRDALRQAYPDIAERIICTHEDLKGAP